ncbi:MAG: tetratricopeptide repeat protein [Desulfobulbaceae bacterium]|nr:tetratricopeptide repeat protein [Desulfobulbaceae bacterium]
MPSSKKLYSDGIALYQKGAFAEAEQAFARTVMAKPNYADAWHMRGVCCLVLNRLGDAEAFIRKALTLKKDADFYANLGITLVEAHKDDEAAIAAYRASLALNPRNAQVCSNLGNLLKKRQENEEAEALYRKAIKLKPDSVYALANLGALLLDRKRYEEAEQLLRRSLALNPAFPNAIKTLGTLLEKTWRTSEAIALFTAAGKWGHLAGNLRMLAAWDDLAKVDAAAIRDLQSDRQNATTPWLLLNLPDMTAQLQRKAARDFAVAELDAELQRPALVNSVTRGGPLRIAYLSADFYNHATMHLLAGVLEAHDAARVEVHLLSINTRSAKDDDPYARRIAALPATFHDLSQASNMEAAERIAGIAPHLLIDLKGYTTDARFGITARRPAPVIINWLGYPGTLGHERLADYIIGDPVVTPPDHAADFSETLALMPHCYQPNDRSRPLGATASRGEEGLPESGLVFCSFNQFIKINPATFDIWCKLLAATPGSVLWLLADPRYQKGETNLRREAEKRGIAHDRLVFGQRKPLAAHLARLPLADLALDTFPCNSHTTASDTLWAGVPLVARMGRTFASRVSASLLTAHGFPELIASDDDSYFELIMSLVKVPEKLRDIRRKLDAARLNSPLFDTARFTRDLERLYEAIWRHHTPANNRAPIVLDPAQHNGI